MSRQIIKQPNGKYCVFSSVVDHILGRNLTPEDIVQEWVKENEFIVRQQVADKISKIENGERPYGQFTISFKDMCETIKRIHGEKEAIKIIGELT